MIVVSVAALAIAACGSDGGASPATDSASSTPKIAAPVELPPDPPAKGGPEGEVAEVINDVQVSFTQGYGTGVCQELTSTARDEVESSGRSCEAEVERTIAGWREEGKTPIVSRVKSVRVKGERAVATLVDQEHGTYRVRVVSPGGGLWLLPQLNLDDPSGMQPQS